MHIIVQFHFGTKKRIESNSESERIVCKKICTFKRNEMRSHRVGLIAFNSNRFSNTRYMHACVPYAQMQKCTHLYSSNMLRPLSNTEHNMDESNRIKPIYKQLFIIIRKIEENTNNCGTINEVRTRIHTHTQTRNET